VQQAASILSKALGANADRLAALASTLGRKADIIEELLGLELDAETWETVRPLVGEHLPVDPAASLSRHFSGARWVERAVEVLIRAAANPELARVIEHPSLPEDLKDVRGHDAQRGLQRAHLGMLSLRQELSSRVDHLARDASQLGQLLDSLGLDLPSKGDGRSTAEMV